jgi:hypothetical protein
MKGGENMSIINKIEEIENGEIKGNEDLMNFVTSLKPDYWSNNACKGYVIVACKKLDLSDKQINDIMSALRRGFDDISVDDAEQIYVNSPY